MNPAKLTLCYTAKHDCTVIATKLTHIAAMHCIRGAMHHAYSQAYVPRIKIVKKLELVSTAVELSG